MEQARSLRTPFPAETIELGESTPQKAIGPTTVGLLDLVMGSPADLDSPKLCSILVVLEQ